jgi:hypothetical protein
MRELIQMIFTFLITVIAWIFFRSDTVSNAVEYIAKLADINAYGLLEVDIKPLFFILILVAVEWLNRKKHHGLELSSVRSRVLRWLIYLTVFVLILLFGASSDSFIYFQF